ncbi:MAG: DUF3168 domain-containing protein [Alphaproteobacteria bacterium]|nr:DUF3168 domain-containing protein [Alphaproteobacteria bacterium]
MSAAAAFDLQTAVYGALASDAALLALLGDPPRLHDDTPAGTGFPLVTLGEVTSLDWSTATESGAEHRLTLNAWSRQGGRAQVQAILGALSARLHLAELSLASHRLVLLRLEFAQVLREGDGETWHGIQRYRALTEDI